MPALRIALAWLLSAGLVQGVPVPQEPVDPALASAVARFFAAQEAEDVEAYLALWSAKARRPRLEMLKYVFETGDDRFSDVRVTRVMPLGDHMRVRVAALRERTQPPRIAGRPPIVRRLTMDVSLTFVREDGDWKLLREGPASDDLAAALIESTSGEERKQLLAAEPDLLDERLVLAISRRAGEAAQQQLYAAAQVGYERMLEVARDVGDRKYEGEALQNLANAFFYQRNFAAALEAYEARLAIERERGDDEAAASALSGVATIRYSFAEYGAALAAYREALAIHERLNDLASMATALVSTGNVLYLQGDFAGAIVDYTRSRELSRKTTNPAGEARALEGLGRVYLAQGDYARALDAFAGVLEEGRARGDHARQGNATLSMGDAHLRLGNIEVARATFEQSRDHFDAAADPANVGRVWQAIALTDLMAGRFALAEEGYERSNASCSPLGDAECMAGADVGLGFAHTAQDEFPDAIASYERAIEGFRALRRPEQTARAQVGLSQALSGSGDYTGALRAATEARHNGIALDSDELVWRALVAEARALRRLGDRDSALAAARAAAAALDRQVERARTRPASPVSRDSTAVFATLAVLQAEAGDAPAAFETAERMRVHDLRIGLARVEREIARGMTAAEREEEQGLAVELVTLHAQLAREKGLPKPDAERIARLEGRIAGATARRASQEARLFARLPDLRVWRGLLEPATRTDAESVLAEPGTVLFTFVVDDEDLLVLSARRGDEGVVHAAHLREVTRKALAEMVAALTPAGVLKDASAWRKAVAPFLDALPEPVRALLAASSRAIVLPHEILWRVPFEALPVGRGVAAGRAQIVYAHSVSTLVRVPRDGVPAAAAAPLSLLVAAAPDLHESARARLAQIAPGWPLRDADAAADEAAAVAGDVPEEHVSVLTRADATEPALRERLAAADVVHLGLPFRINGAGALFSPMLLAGDPGGGADEGARDRGDNGSLEAREVVNLDLRARVAVLSDGAAMSMREAADDAAVVRWAWRTAGVKSILMARWSTDPAASTALLAAFHARLRAGSSAAAAIHAAQRAVRETDGWSTPYYWAGWVLMADW